MLRNLISVVGVSGVLIAAPLGAVLAADMPLKAPPYVPAVSWTGCYINGGVGYGMYNSRHSTEDIGVGSSIETNSAGEGWVGTIGAGCDYQVASSWVIGAFGDYSFMNINGTVQDPAFGDFGNQNESGAWSVGARIGYLVTPKLMTYVNGGYTQAHFDQVNLGFGGAPVFAVPAHDYGGWFLGGGTEYAVTIVPISGLFWRNEYRYSSYDTTDIPTVFIGGGPTGFADHTQKNVQTISSELVWRFNWH